jgi:hypothetical protein
VTTHELKVAYDDALLRSLGKTREELEEHMRFVMAAKLFELGELTSGRAAKLCGMTRVRFLLKLGDIGVSPIDLDDGEIEREIRGG